LHKNPASVGPIDMRSETILGLTYTINVEGSVFYGWVARAPLIN
jgi:hypothetical protein